MPSIHPVYCMAHCYHIYSLYCTLLGAEDVVNFPLSEWWRLASREARHSRLEIFNNALERACKRHRNQNRSVIFISLNDAILDENNGVRPLFRDMNPVNLHLLWEPLIVLWAEKLSSLNIGISPHMLVDMKRSASAYVTRKAQEVGDQVFAIGPRLRIIMDYLQEQSDLASETTEADKKIIEKESRVIAPPVMKDFNTHIDKDKTYGDWRRHGGNSNSAPSNNNRNRRDFDSSAESSNRGTSSSITNRSRETSGHRAISKSSNGIDYSNDGGTLQSYNNNSNNYGGINSSSPSSSKAITAEGAAVIDTEVEGVRHSSSRKNSRDGVLEMSYKAHVESSPRKEQQQRADRRRGSDPGSEVPAAQSQNVVPWTPRDRDRDRDRDRGQREGQGHHQGHGHGTDGNQVRREQVRLSNEKSQSQSQSQVRQERQQKSRPQTLSDRFKSYSDTQGEAHNEVGGTRLIQPFEGLMRNNDGEHSGSFLQRGGGKEDGRHRGNKDGDRERHVRR